MVYQALVDLADIMVGIEAFEFYRIRESRRGIEFAEEYFRKGLWRLAVGDGLIVRGSRKQESREMPEFRLVLSSNNNKSFYSQL